MRSQARTQASALLAIAILSFGHSAVAQPYVGGGGGVARFAESLASEVPTAWLSVPGRTAGVHVDDDSDATWAVFAGWRFHTHFAVELGWYDFGRATSRLSVRETLYDARLEHEISGPGLSLVASWPLGQALSLYGRLGVMDAKVKYREQGFAVLDFTDSQRVELSRSDHSTVPLFGLGIGWVLAPNVEARLDWTRADGIGDDWSIDRNDTGRFDVDAFTVQLLYRF